MAVTISDIARATGLSQSTISKYINGGNVRPVNRKVIEQAIKDYDFHPNEAAQCIRGKAQHLVAIMVPNIDVDYCRNTVIYCEQLLREKGYSTIFYDYGNDPELEEQMLGKIISRRADAIISIAINPEAGGYRRAVESGVPVVFIGGRSTDIGRRVVIRDVEACRKVFGQIREYGHTRIGVIVGRTEYRINPEAIQSFRTALRDVTGSELGDDMIYYSPANSLDAGCRGAKRLLALPEPPTVLICLNTELLLGAKMAILEAGMRIPEDVSLCGFALASAADNEVIRGITVVKQPIYLSAEEAVRIALECINSIAPENVRSISSTSEIHTTAQFGSSIADLRG